MPLPAVSSCGEFAPIGCPVVCLAVVLRSGIVPCSIQLIAKGSVVVEPRAAFRASGYGVAVALPASKTGQVATVRPFSNVCIREQTSALIMAVDSPLAI